MSWGDVSKPSNEPTDKQIQYAEALLEAVYGEIIKPVRKMTKQEVSNLIDELKQMAEDMGVNYHDFSVKPERSSTSRRSRRNYR